MHKRNCHSPPLPSPARPPPPGTQSSVGWKGRSSACKMLLLLRKRRLAAKGLLLRLQWRRRLAARELLLQLLRMRRLAARELLLRLLRRR